MRLQISQRHQAVGLGHDRGHGNSGSVNAAREPAQLKQMKDTMKAPGFPAGWTYGLGLLKIKLSCGGYAYGHGGDIDGYETRTGITEDGRAATIAVTALPTTQAADKVNKALDTALCS